MSTARLVKHNGAMAIEINGKLYPPMTATITTSMLCFNSKEHKIDVEYFKNLGESGIKIFYVMCNNLSADKNGVKDFAAEAEAILKAVPDGYIIMRVSLLPSEEWLKENPSQIVQYSDGRKIHTRLTAESLAIEADGMPSLCSRKWREYMGKALIETVDEVKKLSFADRIVGCFLCAGGTSEWYYINPIEDFSTGAYADLSEAFKEEYKGFLDKKYGEGKAEPVVPDAASRFYTSEVDRLVASPGRVYAGQSAPLTPSNGTNFGAFLDIDNYPRTFDFYRAWHEGTANSIIYFAKLLKEHYGEFLVGAFYGSMGGSEIVWASNGAGVIKVLESGYVDFLADPGVYENRQPGGFTGQRVAWDSFNIHNAMFVVEDDVRTHAENRYFGEMVEMFTLDDTLNVLKRDFGRDICDDLQGWWFDQHVGGGRYKFPEVYELFARQQKIGELAYSLDRRKNNEIAFIYDEESVHTVSRQTTDECVQDIRNYEIANIGAPVDCYYHNDMANDSMPDYKLYVFTNCFYLSDSEREAIKKKLAKNNATALFLYGNGIINPDKEKMLDVKNVSELTGIECACLNENHSPMFRINEKTHKITERFDSRKIFGAFLKERKASVGFIQLAKPRSYLYPVIYPNDSTAESIASFAQTGLPAVSVKKLDGFTSVYCGTKYISADFIREVARFAGCHIYEEDGNVLYANRNFITVHAAKSGEITVKLKEKGSAYELYENKYYAENANEFTFAAKSGDTKMFLIKKENEQ